MKHKRISTFKYYKQALIVLIVLTLAFIWRQSFLPSHVSASESNYVTEKVVHPVEKALTGRETITDMQVRKAAHAIEFAVLGIELALLWVTVIKKNSILLIATSGLLIAAIDECIQLFSIGRGPLLTDVLLDFTSLLIASLICYTFIHERE